MGRASDLFNGHNRTPVLILSGGSQSERSPKSSKEDSAASIQRKKEDETELEMTEEKALTECKDFDNSDDSTWSIGSRYIARYAGWLLGYDQGQLMNTSHSLPSYQATSHIDRSTKT